MSASNPSFLTPSCLRRWLRLLAALTAAALLGACATPGPPFDYSSYKQSRPTTLLVLPPLNDTPDIHGSHGVYAATTMPLAEMGYYVLPIGLVDETFQQNGLSVPADIHAVPPAKLREIFGADAAIYIRVSKYGTTYLVANSDTRVTVEARVIDLRTQQELWRGGATATSLEQGNSSQGGLIGMLVGAVIKQAINTSNDVVLRYADLATWRLLGKRPNGLLFGPRSPNYQKD